MDISEWNAYALTQERVADFERILEIEQDVVREEQKEALENAHQVFSPTQTDSLFWCFYIMKYGFAEYGAMTMTNVFLEEKRIKYEYVAAVRKAKMALKAHKLLLTRDNIDSELANETRISLKTFLALCIVERISVTIVHKRKCFQLSMSSTHHAGGNAGTEVVDTDDEEEDDADEEWEEEEEEEEEDKEMKEKEQSLDDWLNRKSGEQDKRDVEEEKPSIENFATHRHAGGGAGAANDGLYSRPLSLAASSRLASSEKPPTASASHIPSSTIDNSGQRVKTKKRSGHDVFVVHVVDSPLQYTLETNPDLAAWKQYTTTYFPWTSLDKPMKSMSAYKLGELRRMCEQMELIEPDGCGLKRTKQELYDLICANL